MPGLRGMRLEELETLSQKTENESYYIPGPGHLLGIERGKHNFIFWSQFYPEGAYFSLPSEYCGVLDCDIAPEDPIYTSHISAHAVSRRSAVLRIAEWMP